MEGICFPVFAFDGYSDVTAFPDKGQLDRGVEPEDLNDPQIVFVDANGSVLELQRRRLPGRLIASEVVAKLSSERLDRDRYLGVLRSYLRACGGDAGDLGDEELIRRAAAKAASE